MALHQAVLGLRAGEADMSVVSGCNLMLAADQFKTFSSMGLLSPDGVSYAFDSRANGYGRGEGVGTLVIKRLRHEIPLPLPSSLSNASLHLLMVGPVGCHEQRCYRSRRPSACRHSRDIPEPGRQDGHYHVAIPISPDRAHARVLSTGRAQPDQHTVF